MGPYGPTWAHIWAHKGPYGPIYGPIRAHMGPYGPQPGPGPNPDWAPTRPESWATHRRELRDPLGRDGPKKLPSSIII